MKTSLGQLSWKNIVPKIWSDILEKLKSFSTYSFRKQYKNVLLSCRNSCWSSFYMLVSSAILCWRSSCPSNHLPLQLLSSPPVHWHAFIPEFFVVFLFILPDFDSILFLLLFLLLVKRLPLKNWFVLATGLAENLTQLVFCQPFVIQHVRTRSLYCETWNVWCFYILINGSFHAKWANVIHQVFSISMKSGALVDPTEKLLQKIFEKLP